MNFHMLLKTDQLYSYHVKEGKNSSVEDLWEYTEMEFRKRSKVIHRFLCRNFSWMEATRSTHRLTFFTLGSQGHLSSQYGECKRAIGLMIHWFEIVDEEFVSLKYSALFHQKA